ncbi:unnamed protein product [Vitrella brassicaformis CCMP3155]|uniref:Uncharacterized protein n=1 Tax=Vitrella brassicaformis (strain CCMP3155) TaxID=1169540 RepID=A0A0G4ETW0_VITBC|nr:unnamed protein product [Vitrella brassicaformis CCMP3155]|eukprot:CEM01694.1 unnamed protein product [Vitrella brassicaformis CCMP3155]
MAPNTGPQYTRLQFIQAYRLYKQQQQQQEEEVAGARGQRITNTNIRRRQHIYYQASEMWAEGKDEGEIRGSLMAQLGGTMDVDEARTLVTRRQCHQERHERRPVAWE